MGYAIGIDLGSTFSCVGVYYNEKVNIIPNKLGNPTTPSWISYSNNNKEMLIGELAKNNYIKNPTRTFYNTKRFIGRSPFDPVLINHNKDVSYDVLSTDPIHIASNIINYLKDIAEDFIGDKVTDCVITVPAYFNDSQRVATKESCEAVNLNVLRIINEPTAASIAYGTYSCKDNSKGKNNEDNEDNEDNGYVLVYDLGGSTFDASILRIEDGIYEVKGTIGDCTIGGEDIDKNLMYHIIKKIITNEKYKNKKITKRGYSVIKKECENIKKALSKSTNETIYLESIFSDGSDYSLSISRTLFNHLNEELLNRTINYITTLLKNINLSKQDISNVILIGGSTKIPLVKELLNNYFNKENTNNCEINDKINPDEAVAYGASIQAAILNDFNKEKIVDELDDILLIDVCPLTIGIETEGGIMTEVIPRNTKIPVTKTQIFTTYEDNQTEITISVFEGERKFVKDNHLLSTFDLEGLEKVPKGVPKIQVTFDIDSNGVLSISSKDLMTKKEKKIVIDKESRIRSKKVVDKLIEEANNMNIEESKVSNFIKEKYELLNKINNALSSDISDKTVVIKLSKIKEKLQKEKLSKKEFDNIKSLFDHNPNLDKRKKTTNY